MAKKRRQAAVDALLVVEMFRGARRLCEAAAARPAGAQLVIPLIPEMVARSYRERAIEILTDASWGPMSDEYRRKLLDLAPGFVSGDLA
jgi:hypothetical protein